MSPKVLRTDFSLEGENVSSCRDLADSRIWMRAKNDVQMSVLKFLSF